MPVASGHTMQTEADRLSEEEILHLAYGKGIRSAKRLGKFASADWLVDRNGRMLVVEVKDRYLYKMAYFVKNGYIISADKVRRIIAEGEKYGAIPTLMLRSSDGHIVTIYAALVPKYCSVIDFIRKRGAAKRKELSEKVYVVPAKMFCPTGFRLPDWQW